MAEAITVDIYRQRLARHMADDSPLPPIAFMAFGDGGHNDDLTPKPPSAAATALAHELLRKPLALITQEDAFSVTGKGIIEEKELVGARLSEAGLLDADGGLIGLKTFAPKSKESDERYEISIKLRF
jgi:phage-related tail fiber protein